MHIAPTNLAPGMTPTFVVPYPAPGLSSPLWVKVLDHGTGEVVPVPGIDDATKFGCAHAAGRYRHAFCAEYAPVPVIRLHWGWVPARHVYADMPRVYAVPPAS
jgi:hypothetical protein